MKEQQQLQKSHKPLKHKGFSWRRLCFIIIVIGAIAITVVWILSGLSIIPSTWAIVFSAIVTVLGVMVGLWPLVFPPEKSESLHRSSNIQEITATRHSDIDEPEQDIEGGVGTNRQTARADDNSKISRSKQNIKLT